MIFESHAHYDDERFNEDREELLEGLEKAGITHVINVGANMESSGTTLKLAEQYSFLYAALGVHPEDAAEITDENLILLENLCSTNHISRGGKVVAVGEIGLDYYWEQDNKELQKKAFENQLELALKLDLPVIIHSRDAAADTAEILRQYHGKGLRGVIHCYSYSREMAKVFLDMGFYIGIGGVVTFQNAKKVKEAVESIPLERLLVETDSPYLAPVPNRGQRNSSLNLPYIIQEIARLKGTTPEEVTKQTEQNAFHLFQIVQ